MILSFLWNGGVKQTVFVECLYYIYKYIYWNCLFLSGRWLKLVIVLLLSQNKQRYKKKIHGYCISDNNRTISSHTSSIFLFFSWRRTSASGACNLMFWNSLNEHTIWIQLKCLYGFTHLPGTHLYIGCIFNTCTTIRSTEEAVLRPQYSPMLLYWPRPLGCGQYMMAKGSIIIFTTQRYSCLFNCNAKVFRFWQEGSIATGILPTPILSSAHFRWYCKIKTWQIIYTVPRYTYPYIPQSKLPHLVFRAVHPFVFYERPPPPL